VVVDRQRGRVLVERSVAAVPIGLACDRLAEQILLDVRDVERLDPRVVRPDVLANGPERLRSREAAINVKFCSGPTPMYTPPAGRLLRSFATATSCGSFDVKLLE
jgi:hypothetical protein